jgi:hypothetical protein
MFIRNLVPTLLVCSVAFSGAATADETAPGITEPCAASVQAAETPRVELRRGTRPSSSPGGDFVQAGDLVWVSVPPAAAATFRVLPRRGTRITHETAKADTGEPVLLTATSRGDAQAATTRHARRVANRTSSVVGTNDSGLGCPGLAMADW